MRWSTLPTHSCCISCSPPAPFEQAAAIKVAFVHRPCREHHPLKTVLPAAAKERPPLLEPLVRTRGRACLRRWRVYTHTHTRHATPQYAHLRGLGIREGGALDLPARGAARARASTTSASVIARTEHRLALTTVAGLTVRLTRSFETVPWLRSRGEPSGGVAGLPSVSWGGGPGSGGLRRESTRGDRATPVGKLSMSGRDLKAATAASSPYPITPAPSPASDMARRSRAEGRRRNIVNAKL